MAVLGHVTYRFIVEVYRDGVPGSAGVTEGHVWDVVADDTESAHLKIHSRALETVRPLLDSYRATSFERVTPLDPTHYHVDVHSGPTPDPATGWGTAWATLEDALANFKGSLGTRTTGTRVALVTCESPSCWT
ncbi:hypothetical protein ACFV0L_10430 [Streptosporangium canum]|uniref:hypothetical protein n=1 Tax=Streptosporangium canum TaxID=324952 RepID=UPI00367F2B7F